MSPRPNYSSLVKFLLKAVEFISYLIAGFIIACSLFALLQAVDVLDSLIEGMEIVAPFVALFLIGLLGIVAIVESWK